MKIQTARETYKTDPFLKVSIYGASGVGKTEWACTAPRPLIAVTEPQAMATIASRNPDALIVLINGFDDFRELFNAMKLAKPIILDDGQPALDVGGNVVQTFVLDSGTDLQRMMIARLLGGEKDDALNFDAAMKSLSIQQWGRIMDSCTQIWREQRALRCNTIFIHLADTELDDENRRMSVPSLYGKKLPFELGQYFNAQGIALVARESATGKATHAIRWVADSARYQAKPAPGWPAFIRNTQTPGQTTLGSLALFSAPPGMIVPHAEGDSAEWVRQAEPDPDGSAYESAPRSDASSGTSNEEQKATKAEPRRRRR